LLSDFYNLVIGGKYVRCKASNKSTDGVVISGIDKEISEAEIFEILRSATNRRILDLFLVRGEAVENPPCSSCEEALLKEISPFMPKRNPHTNCCRVQVLPPEQKDTFIRAFITFDGRLHLEAAKALEQLEGKVLPGCLSWQKIKCQQLFHSSLSCPAPVFFVIKKQLDPLLESFRHLTGTARGTLSFYIQMFIHYFFLFIFCFFLLLFWACCKSLDYLPFVFLSHLTLFSVLFGSLNFL